MSWLKACTSARFQGMCSCEETWGRILGRNPDTEFFSCYSQSPPQLCLEISISSNSRNLLQFLQLQLHCEGERWKTWWKTIPPSLWFKKSIQKPQVWELSRLCSETLNEIVRSWIRLLEIQRALKKLLDLAQAYGENPCTWANRTKTYHINSRKHRFIRKKAPKLWILSFS